MILSIIINVIILTIGAVGAIIVACASLKGLIEDVIIIRKGNKYAGECVDGKFYGREYYFIVQWIQDDIQHEDRFLAISRTRKYPYRVTVYSYNHKTNLGIKSVLYNLLYVIFFFAILTAFTILIIYR